MIERLTDFLIERRNRKNRIDIYKKYPDSRKQFCRLLNTLRTNSVMVVTHDDGIYIRLAGDESKGEAFTLRWAKVLDFNDKVEV